MKRFLITYTIEIRKAMCLPQPIWRNTMNEKVEPIIHSHMIYSMTAGAIPIPLADIAAVTAIQMDMLRQIAGVYSVSWDENKGKNLASAIMGAAAARLGASLIKSLPGVGTLIGLGSQIILSGASTYALGYIFDRHYSEGGTLSDVNIDSMKKLYASMLEKGKDVAAQIKGSLKKEDAAASLEKLKKMKEGGTITEKDYEETKKRILDRMVS